MAFGEENSGCVNVLVVDENIYWFNCGCLFF